MYRSFAFAVVALAVLATAFWAFRGGAGGAEAPSFRVEEHGGITVIRLSGPPRPRGRALAASRARSNLAVWGSAWHPAGGSRSLATDEPEPDRQRTVAEAARLLEGPPPPGRTLVSLRAGDGFCLIVAGPSGHREFRLGGE